MIFTWTKADATNATSERGAAKIRYAFIGVRNIGRPFGVDVPGGF
jgi:hypothetical protein